MPSLPCSRSKSRLVARLGTLVGQLQIPCWLMDTGGFGLPVTISRPHTTPSPSLQRGSQHNQQPAPKLEGKG